MNKLWRYILIFFLCNLPSLFSQIPVTGIWHFKIGDNPAWAKKNYPDNNWNYLDVPREWTSAGNSSYNGYAWYRYDIFIPKRWQRSKYVQIKGALSLKLGYIDEVDETFFNGTKIGSTGNFPPNFKSAWHVLRVYTIPNHLVRWGKMNTIAVRVYNSDARGGIYSGTPTLYQPSQTDYLDFQINFDRQNRIYQRGDILNVEAIIQNNSFDSLCTNYTWQLYVENGGFIDSLLRPINIDIGKESTQIGQFKLRNAGFYTLKTGYFQNKQLLFQKEFTLACAPERLKNRSVAPANFAAFWQRSLTQLALIPPQEDVVRYEFLETDSRRVFKVTLLSFDNVGIEGWYTLPRYGHNFPVLLEVNSYRDTLGPALTAEYDSLAVFSLNVRGNGYHQDEVKPGFPGALVWNINTQEKYLLRGAIMDCIRGLDFLSNQPMLDTSKVAISGLNMGGTLAFAAGALDSRVKLTLVDSPLFAAYRVAKKYNSFLYNEIIQYIVNHPSDHRKVYSTLKYFDLQNFAPLLKTPFFISSGLHNNISHPITAFLVYNQVESEKEYFISPEADGIIQTQDSRQAMFRWLRRQFELPETYR
ncbi:acetylxylan esterase [bacterium]|nr:acetylxylan esterase [bacterium]